MDAQRNAPVYNIKAMAHITGVPADTLRRWESRYNVISPQRTESGYRLYSQRDVDTILWLKGKIDEGLSISRACDMLRQLGGDPKELKAATPTMQSPAPADTYNELRSLEVLRAELLDAFRSIDEVRAGTVLTEALSLYTLEEICLRLLQPALVSVGEAWLNGEISVAVEHFASSFVRSRLSNLFHSSPYDATGPLVIVGCAPEEFHELGVMFLAVFLRRSGFRVVYLGQNVPIESLQGMVSAMHPDAICISATRAETAASLYGLGDFLRNLKDKNGRAPLLAYGGQVFNRFPHISNRLGGVYLGEDAGKAVRTLNEHLRPSA